MTMQLYRFETFDIKNDSVRKDMSVLRKFRHEDLEVDTYHMKRGTSLFVDAPPEGSIKTYSVVKGSLRNLETGLSIGPGDIFRPDRPFEYLHFEIEEDCAIVVHAIRNSAYDGWKDNENSIQDVLNRIQEKDHYTGVHCEHVFRYVSRLARRMGVRSKELYHLHKAARFHDIGKVYVDEDILNKCGKLSAEEHERMKSHVRLGKETILKHFPEEVFDIISLHHERMDGSGYPNGLSGTEIPLSGRILAVCDCYDAIVTDRIYKKGKMRKDAITELVEMAPHKLDAHVVDEFITVLGDMAKEEAEMAERRRRLMPPWKRIVTE